MRKKYFFTDDFVQRLVNEYELGRESTTSLHEKYGIDTRTITRLFHKAGHKLRTRSEANCIGFVRQRIGNGGKYKDLTHGYVFIKIPSHPKANKRGYVPEHVLIWEKSNKEVVPKGYIIHHLNGKRDDNKPNNLVAMKKSEHVQQAEPYKRRIKELEDEIILLCTVLIYKQGNMGHSRKQGLCDKDFRPMVSHI